MPTGVHNTIKGEYVELNGQQPNQSMKIAVCKYNLFLQTHSSITHPFTRSALQCMRINFIFVRRLQLIGEFPSSLSPEMVRQSAMFV